VVSTSDYEAKGCEFETWRGFVLSIHRSSSLKSLSGVMTMLGVPSVGWGH